MTRRRRLALAWGAGGVVILGAVATALINELHAGWGWRIGAGAAVVLWSVAAAWLAFRTGGGDGRIRVDTAGVYAGRNIDSGVRTHAEGVSPVDDGETRAATEGIDVGRGAVFAGQDITGGVSTEIHVAGEPTRVPQRTDRPVGPPPPPVPPPLPPRPGSPNSR